MNQLDRQVRYPLTLFFVFLAMACALNVYGLREGTFLILDLIAGIFLYKMLTARS